VSFNNMTKLAAIVLNISTFQCNFRTCNQVPWITTHKQCQPDGLHGNVDPCSKNAPSVHLKSHNRIRNFAQYDKHHVHLRQLCQSKYFLANLPPTLSKSQVSSVRKHLKLQLLNLLKHPASFELLSNITTLLMDLGATQSEVTQLLAMESTIDSLSLLFYFHEPKFTGVD
jgi:hypothetical protein